MKAGAKALGLPFAVALLGCGYQLAHELKDPLGPFAVGAGRQLTPHAVAAVELEGGARAELARAGELASCAPGHEGCNALVVELVRTDEESEGIQLPGSLAAPSTGASLAAAAPVARALRVTLVGRAFLLLGASAAEERSTGEVRSTEVIATHADPATAVLARENAARLAARRLGQRLVRRVLGQPDPAEP